MESTDDNHISSRTETDAADGRTGANEQRKTILITILSTLIVTVIAGLMIHYFTKEPNLPTITYSSDIVGFVDFAGVKGGRIQANGVSVPSLATVRLHIRNTSDAVVKDIPIHVQLVESSEDFTLLALGHNPKPEIAFGTIRTEKRDEKSLVFTYELLKPKEHDEVLFVVTCPPKVELYTKASVKLSKFRWYSNQASKFVLTFVLLAVALVVIIFLLQKAK
jgi:hypothetical protein